ncbi:hypothetical protein N7474_010495 [Penicillium riverlandense]|uniref:uncharacterized protein n=1 Tax=Penicillium riverlandense TaxID=1903569 RepID=UPI002547A170|nr:uncharacterized protein N7474_010495 [Penicillium riverlandense]KAJ5806903.1 hypothetical protein N7474_010495 [Penicillium riverlandense]
MRRINHHELSDRRNSNCISPVAELDSKVRNPQRRRVPVACGRCRRRKIKCSGDNGDGHACSNCRSAGNTDCQFLRMKAKTFNEMHEMLVTSNEWQYSIGSSIAPSPRLGIYAAHAPGKPTLLSMGSPQTRMAGLAHPAEYDAGAVNQHGFPRLSVGADHSLHYDDEQSANYSAHSQQNMLPSNIMDYGASAWSPKAWNSMFNTSRGTTGGCIYPDSETNGSMSGYNYVLPSHGNPVTEMSQSPMTSAPSAEAPGITLPMPTCRSQQLQTGLSSLPEGISNVPLSSEYKNSFWNPRCDTSLTQRATPMLPSNDTSFNTSASSTRIKTDTSNVPDLTFGYLPTPTTTDNITPSLSSGTPSLPSSASSSHCPYPGLEQIDSSSSSPTDTRMTRSFSREQTSNNNSSGQQRHLALNTDCNLGIYGYASSERSKRNSTDAGDTRCSAPTLLNGLPYNRVRHADPPSAAFSFNLLPTDSLAEYPRPVAVSMHRPSVSPLGNQGY